MRRREVGLAVAVALALGVPPARAELPGGDGCETYDIGGVVVVERCGIDYCVKVPTQGYKCLPIEPCLTPGGPCLPPPELVNMLLSPVDPADCEALVTLAPTVNGFGHPELLYIDPVFGDVYVGTGLLWDCQPYVVG